MHRRRYHTVVELTKPSSAVKLPLIHRSPAYLSLWAGRSTFNAPFRHYPSASCARWQTFRHAARHPRRRSDSLILGHPSCRIGENGFMLPERWREIEPLYREKLGQSPSQRSDCLRGAGGGDRGQILRPPASSLPPGSFHLEGGAVNLDATAHSEVELVGSCGQSGRFEVEDIPTGAAKRGIETEVAVRIGVPGFLYSSRNR